MVKNPSVQPYTMKFLQEDLKENLIDMNFGKGFLFCLFIF